MIPAYRSRACNVRQAVRARAADRQTIPKWHGFFPHGEALAHAEKPRAQAGHYSRLYFPPTAPGSIAFLSSALYVSPMSFVGLQEHLRKELRRRIDASELTGMELARRTGFTQAHISNFLNRKRGLKLSALDRMLKAIGLSVYDLLNPHELVRFAAVPPGSDQEYADVPVVKAVIAGSSPVIVNEEVEELMKFPRSFLSRLRADLSLPARKTWTRFVLVRADPRDAAAMWPRFGAGAALLVDRHYTSLRPYRKNERNLYAVRHKESLAFRYVEASERHLVLRSHNPDSSVDVLPLEESQSAGDLLVGRIAHAAMEL